MKAKPSQKNIPLDWQQVKLGDCLERMEGGGTPSKEKPEYWNGSIPWASVKDVVTHNSKDTQDHISELGLNYSSSRLVKKGTLIVPTRMALGHAVVFDVDVAINQDLKALYPKKTLLNDYLFHWFKSKKSFIERLGSGSTVSGIQQNELKNIKFLLPSLPEQNRIVAVLETWDRAIEKLVKKIEVKKQIKKGLMQRLLTSKTRLPGFTKVWARATLGDVGKIIGGGTPDTTKVEYWNGDIEWFTPTEVKKKNLHSSRRKISSLGLSNSSATLLPKGTLLLTSRATIGDIGIAMNQCATNQGFQSIVVNDNNSNEFLYYWILVNKNELIRRSNGSTFSEISGTEIRKVKIQIPETEEQFAIAEILTTADKEIDELKKKLSIFKEQKRYLLNNLITGTIRTPEDLMEKV